jgi:tRNA pseudouridine38-40 synthase
LEGYLTERQLTEGYLVKGYLMEKKKRIGIVVAYDGTAYSGWQIQPNGVTIQGVLNETLSRLLGEKIEVMGASRTDAGVHAMGNVAVFDTTARMPIEKIALAVNTYLPPDIRVQESVHVSDDFHPRFCDTTKTYRYQIWNRRIPNPLVSRYSTYYYYALDEKKMNQAAQYLVGEHDFGSFCTAKPDRPNHVRTIYRCDVTREGDMITVMISGNGFLYNMVRIIVGTLFQIGGGLIPAEEMKEILEAKDRSRAGDTARPEGLTLMGIEYH